MLNTYGKVKFTSGEAIKHVNQARYLGVLLQHRNKPDVEISNRLKQTHITWNKLHKYWKLDKVSKKRRLQVWNAVIKTKLIYGLETLTLTEAQQSKLNTFQLKGIRQILKLHTTYLDRENTNKKLYEMANNIAGNATNPKPFRQISSQIKRNSLKYFGHLVREGYEEPTRKATFTARMWPNIGTKNRCGRPRHNWILKNMKKAWKRVKQKLMLDEDEDKHIRFDHRNRKIRSWIEYGAIWRVF